MLKQFVNHNEANDLVVHHVDTARIYAGGKTEPIVGNVLRSCTPSKGTIVLGTKAHPSVEGGLSAQGIKSQLKESLHAMGVTSFGEYYLHQPDMEHAFLESLTCAHELVKDGVVGTIGMNNDHASEMERAFQLCGAHGLTRPSVYQRLYNPLNRAVGVICGCLEQVAATDFEVRVLEVFQEAPRFDSHPASRLGCLDRKLASERRLRLHSQIFWVQVRTPMP